MARRKRQETHENHERWLVSYADFITLLFAFFVVMYSISSVNEGKYRVLSDTLVSAFRTPPKSPTPISIGETSSAPRAIDRSTTPSQIKLTPATSTSAAEGMKRISTKVEASLHGLIAQDLVKVTRNKLWVKVEMDTSMLFGSGSARLQSQARLPLEELALELSQLPNHVEIEGHTDNRPIKTAAFRSNWELSAARAASVVHLFSETGVAPERMAAIGFGQHRPLDTNDTPAGRSRNRRVVIVILANKDARRMMEIDPTGQESGQE